MTDERDETVDDLVPDVPANPPDGLGVDGSGTALVAPDETDPYGLEIKGAADIVHSDLVGAAELSAEYLEGNAADDAHANVEEVDRAWHEAARDLEPGDLE